MANRDFDFPLFTTPEKNCPHCNASLVNEYEECSCPGAQAERAANPKPPVKPGKPFTGKLPQCLITIPEKDCPHCGKSLANEHEFCGCPGSIAARDSKPGSC